MALATTKRKSTARPAQPECHSLPLLSREAAFDAGSFNEQDRTVELVWSSGFRGPRRRLVGWDEVLEYDEELSMDPAHVRMERLNNGAALLNTHNQWDVESILGVVERAWLANGEGRAVVRFSKRADVAPIADDVQSGIIRNVSVGYAVHRYEVIKEAGKKELWRAVDWEPMEISLVPVPFDPKAGTRSQDSRTFTCEVVGRPASPVSDRSALWRRLQHAGLRA